MSLKRSLIRLFDRPGGRAFLGGVATAWARRVSGADVAVFHDQYWIHRVGTCFFPDGDRFEYYGNDFEAWKRQETDYLEHSRNLWFLHFHPAPGNVVVDIGAGRGEDALGFSRGVGPSGRVFAIEANPRSCDLLRRFCALNELANVTCLNIAIVDRSRIVSVSDSDFWQGNAVAHEPAAGDRQVPGLSLDDLCAAEGIDTIDFLKLNIEGGEREAILGMERSIGRVRNVCIACHDFLADEGKSERHRTRDVVERFLTENGFRVHRRMDHPSSAVRDHLFGTRASA